MFKVNNKDTRTTPTSIVNFEQVNAGWVNCIMNYIVIRLISLNPLSANPTKWSNTLKQFFGKNRRIDCV